MNKRSRIIRGVISVNSRGVGYISDKEGKDDIIIENQDLLTALNNDEVEVIRHLQRAGKVLRVIKRAKTRFVGTIEEQNSQFILRTDDFKMYVPILIPNPPKDAEKGLKALVEIKEWKTGQNPTGEIIKIIGRKGEHEVEIESIVLERGFESSFPKYVEKEANEIKKEINKEEIKSRRDFREEILFTIDPKEAKDFDDALSFKKLQNGNFEIGIHIADVSHYVREGTALDREAEKRGTSIYMVDRTIPMLPQALSDDICSLNPNADRLAFSALFEINKNGHIHRHWFGKSIIHSKKRFTYEDAQEMIESTAKETDNLRDALITLNVIAKKLRSEKTKNGAIEFEHEEIGFELSSDGYPLRIFKKKRLDSHRLVEEFMLLANREIAKFLWRKSRQSNMQFLYRIHNVPDREKISQLSVFVRALGHELPMTKDKTIKGKDLQALFKKIEGKAEESLIKKAAIRSMAKAVYSTKNIGHFGLAFEFYTHFTSPIRRYPDLITHRLLQDILIGRKYDSAKSARLEQIAEHSTKKEISASEAERESIKLKQVEFMLGLLNKEFKGTISGVTEWGMYIEEENTKAEGMIKLRDLGDDYYMLDEKNYRIIGKRTKKKYSLGDKISFKVVGADIERKTLDYRLI